MKALVFFWAMGVGLLLAAVFGTPPTPQPLIANGEYAHYDLQVHSRDSVSGFEGMMAEHGADCSGPPATHPVTSFADSVFICNDHLMTAVNAGGYGLAVITPSQLLDCSVICSVQWDMSTERLSIRDWPDVWITPWADNLTLPFDEGDVDLQGVPRVGLHINLNDNQNTWLVEGIQNYVETEYSNRYGQPSIQAGIVAGTNQAAVRQTFRISITGSRVRVERLASATASAAVYFDGNVSGGSLGNGLVVQFAHHAYNPTKDGAGQPATWHWSGFTLTPSVPFALIHGERLVTHSGGTVRLDAPAPPNAYLRFSAICAVKVDGVTAPKQRFNGHYEHASSYFVPIAAGKTSVNIALGPDNWVTDSWSPGCYAQDFAIWAQGGAVSTPTSIPATSTPSTTPTPTSIPTLTPTPTTVPMTSTATATSTPTPTATVAPTSTSTPLIPSPTPTPVCNQAYYRNSVLTLGPPMVCP